MFFNSDKLLLIRSRLRFSINGFEVALSILRGMVEIFSWPIIFLLCGAIFRFISDFCFISKIETYCYLKVFVINGISSVRSFYNIPMDEFSEDGGRGANEVSEAVKIKRRMKRCGVTEETRRSLLISLGLSERTSEVWLRNSYW